jgi:hypothetical protein
MIGSTFSAYDFGTVLQSTGFGPLPPFLLQDAARRIKEDTIRNAVFIPWILIMVQSDWIIINAKSSGKVLYPIFYWVRAGIEVLKIVFLPVIFMFITACALPLAFAD